MVESYPRGPTSDPVSPKHLALREDVHQLGVLVGEMPRSRAATSCIRWSRVIDAKPSCAANRKAPPASLHSGSAGRPPALARDLVRAFSTWFQAVNLAEKVHRIRRRREYFLRRWRHARSPAASRTPPAQIKAQGLSLEEMLALLVPFDPAHPDFALHRVTAPHTIAALAAHGAGLAWTGSNPNLDPQEQRHLWARLRTEITTGWQTEEHPRQRLTVADEREFALFHFAEVLYRIVPRFYEEIGVALEGPLWRQRGIAGSAHRAVFRQLGGRGHGRHAGRACQDHPRNL